MQGGHVVGIVEEYAQWTCGINQSLHCLGPTPAQITFSITHEVVYMPDERVLDLDQQQYTICTSVVLVQRSDI